NLLPTAATDLFTLCCPPRRPRSVGQACNAARASQSSYHGGFFRGFRRQHKTASVCTHFACLSETQRQSDVTSLLRWARGRYSAPGPGFEPGLTDPEVPHRE